MIRYSAIGAVGYVCGEVLRMMVAHPEGQLVNVLDSFGVGQKICEHHPALRGFYDQEIMDLTDENVRETARNSDVVLVQVPSGQVAHLAEIILAEGSRVIDIGADIRFRDVKVWEQWYNDKHPNPQMTYEAVYSMPEMNRELAKGKKLIANPGCYPTSILLPLIPLFRAGMLEPEDVVVCSGSGVSGAGRKASIPLLFCECNESFHAYGVPKHRHLSEIEQELSLAAGETVVMSFTPHLIPVNTGICSTITAKVKKGADPESVGRLLEEAYAAAPFVRLLGRNQPADTKNVTRTNCVDIGWAYDPRTNRVILMSAEDNVVKGAGGQAVQSFNIMCGFDETEGLWVL